VNVRDRSATLDKARESPFFKSPKQSAATVALAADYKLLLDLARLLAYGANCSAYCFTMVPMLWIPLVLVLIYLSSFPPAPITKWRRACPSGNVQFMVPVPFASTA
jgi:hypothetical protein